MPLTEAERIRIRQHLSYTVLSTPTTLSLGFPEITQADFIVENNALNIQPSAEPLIRTKLETLDCLMERMTQVAIGSDIKKTGTIEFRPGDAIDDLQHLYQWHQRHLADMVGAPVNPISLRDQPRGVVEPC